VCGDGNHEYIQYTILPGIKQSFFGVLTILLTIPVTAIAGKRAKKTEAADAASVFYGKYRLT
jgi:uncharacterized membrane protein